MRTALAASPHPLGGTLPALFADDDLVQLLCGALDEVIGPVFEVLDSLPAYLDPRTTPPDLLPWLASWVALGMADSSSDDRLRELVRTAHEVNAWRGTARGLRAAVDAALGLPVEISDSGGATWSVEPGAPLPGTPSPYVQVTVFADDPGGVDLVELGGLVAAVKPAHVGHGVQALPPGAAS